MRGAIFMCNKQARHECFKRRVFGLPATKLNFVKQIKKGMVLFLFDTDDRKMYGVFEAISDGGMNYAPNAYENSGSRFPAQVRFKIIWKCRYLTEAEFKPAIIANYFTSNKFNQHLTFEQVSHLLSLFEAKKKTADEESRSPRTSSSASPSPRTSSRLSSNPNPSFNPDSYQFQSSNFDSRRLSSNPNPDPERYKYQSSNSDSMCLSSNPNPNPDPYQYQSSNTDSMRLSSNPNPNPVSYQSQMSNFDNMHLSSNPNPASYQYSTHASLYQYLYDPNNPGIANSSAYNTQNNQQNQTGTVSEPKCETGLNSNQDHTKPHPHCDYCAIKNNGEYNSSSQSMQFYMSTPQNYNNITIGGEVSNVAEGSQHQSHICNQVPENFYASVFERLHGIPCAQQNPNFVPESPNPNPRLYADSERPSVFSRLIVKEQKVETKPSKNDDEPSIDQLLYSLREKSNQWPGERKGKPKSNQWINDKTMKFVIEKQPSTEIEAKEESGSDGNKMDVDLIEPNLEKFDLGEKIPFLNFKRRSGERKVSVEPGEEGSKKKRRFVRPSLEIEGPIRKIDTSFDELMKEAETKEINVEKKDFKEVETEGKYEEKKDSKEAEIELELGAPNMHEFEAKTEEKIVSVPGCMEIGSEKQKYDLQGPSCKNGISKDIEMECELGLTTAEPQEEGEIIFSPLLQINEELGPTQNNNLSTYEGKHGNIEKHTAFNQESNIEKNKIENKHVDKNLSVIELETKNEVGETELGGKNEARNHDEKLNLVEKEAQNFMQINPINNCGEVLELRDKNEQKNDNTNLNVTKLAPKSLMEISPVKFYGQVTKLDEKIEEKKELIGIERCLPKEETDSKFMIPKDATKPESEIPKIETELKSGIPNREKAEPKSDIPNPDAQLKSGIPNQEAEPKSENPKDEAELESGFPNQEEPKSGISKDEVEPNSRIPNQEGEPKSKTSKDKTETKSEILKEESEPRSGNSKPSLGFDILSIIRKAKAEKLNEAGGPCKDKDEFINGDFIALD